ncbi:MAG: EAL domain-containing protein [Pseudobutyrivibrio sp.]|nr:EAL domain-containing protein [Pseudobutyrivibrio sp.]
MKSDLFFQIINALETHEIKAYYQPQYDSNSGRLVSAEALVRWEREDGTLVMPDDFVPLLEESDAICTLDWFMAEEVCKTLREMGENAIPIAVNFSRWHIRENDFCRKLNGLLQTYGINPKLFEVEITESALSEEDFCVVERWVYGIADLGVRIAIDDFGAGFTSLQFVKDLPVDFLKIDKAFLADNCQNERGRGTLETVFFFASKLHLHTIAEGVETIEQLKFLQNMDCDRVQGYLFSKPLRKEDFIVIALFDNEPAVDEKDIYLETFSSNRALLDTIKKEYQIVIFGNLFKNSYYLMHQAPEMDFGAPTAGVIDDMTENAMAQSPKGYDKKYFDTLSREALINAYNEGKRRVEVEVKQKVEDGMILTLYTVVHLSKHPYRDDILMVGMSRVISKE